VGGGMKEAVSGAIAMGYVVAGLFFLRFWKRGKDPLFLSFAVAFWIFGATRIGLVFTFERFEGTVFYVFRFIAFSIILWAIYNKNTTSKNNSTDS
jgi:hypothetical protein